MRKANRGQFSESLILKHSFSLSTNLFLSDKLHELVCKVIQATSMGNESFLTFDPTGRKPKLLCYDLQAAALIVVTMKLLFRLDDKMEW